MKNIFSYQIGSIFTGKEIKDFLIEWKKRNKSLYRLSQYLNCKDNILYQMVYLPGTAVGEKYRGFIKI